MSQQLVMVAGEQVPVQVDPGQLRPVTDALTKPEVVKLLTDAGLAAGEDVDETAQALDEAGYFLPSAWSVVVRTELVEAGIAPGYLNSLTAKFQKFVIRRCGVPFVQLMVGMEDRTDAQVALDILKAKQQPLAPAVSADSGWSPTAEGWRDYLQQLANWVATVDGQLAAAVRQIVRDYAVELEDLAVGALSARSVALGSVLRGSSGIKEISRLVTASALAEGCGLTIIREVSTLVFSDEDEEFRSWQHPQQITSPHLVESEMLAWSNKRQQLREGGNKAVDVDCIVKDSLVELLSGVPEVKSMMILLKKQHGRALSVAQIQSRVAIDSPGWLMQSQCRECEKQG